MANIKDFAAGIVVTPPSPATSGTSLTLRTGDGASMPTPPFYVTATPPGQLTTLGTSEKLLVTGVSTDTLTIVRAQSPTTAKSIDANWVVANAMYVDDVMKSNIATDELLTGTVNGSNTVFTTASAFTAIQVYKNGVAMHLGDDFTVTGSNQITMVTAPATGTKLTATYIIGSQVMIAGSSSLTTDETPTGTVNGSNTSFTTAKPYVANTLQVYINGVKQKRGTHFSEVTPTSGTFTISDAPLTGDDVMVEYQFVQSVAGNADTVDGFHASTTATANQLFPLNGSGVYPNTVLETNKLGYTTVTTTQGSITNTEVDLTGMTLTVTAPGNKDIKITSYTWPSSTVAGDNCRVFVKEGSTYHGSHTINIPSSGLGYNQQFVCIIPAPSAGSHTYKITMQRTAGSGTLSSNAGSASNTNTPAFLLAEVI